MRFGKLEFGSIEIDGVSYEHDVVIDGGHLRKRKKGPSKPYRAEFAHTPLSADEAIPWDCRRLIIGSGIYGSLPVMEGVLEEAKGRQVELVVVPTAQAIVELEKAGPRTNAILHVTC
jgi:hypothetical protein